MAIEILSSHFDDQDFWNFFFLVFFVLTIWDYILVQLRWVWTQFLWTSHPTQVHLSP